MKKLRLAYFGTPDFSAAFLEKMYADKDLPIEIALVVTQEDKIVGRNSEPTSNAVKTFAKTHNIDIAHSLSGYDCTYREIDIAFVFAYGKIIKQDLLRAPKLGFWNLHPSMLPNFRGASPTVYPLILGKDQTGVSLMVMDEEMDHGPIIEQVPLPISATITHKDLLTELTSIGYTLFAKHIKQLAAGTMDYSDLPVQNHTAATFTRMLSRDDGRIELALLQKALNKEHIESAELPVLIQQYLGKNTITEYPIPYAPYIVYNLYRGLHPWPGVWTEVTIGDVSKRLKLTSMALQGQDLVIQRVQLEGKNEVDFAQFQAAYPSVGGPTPTASVLE